MEVALAHVLIGNVSEQALGVASGIDKRPVEGIVRITRTGLEGDEQADLKHHGGLEKAVHHYALDHYAAWAAEHPSLREILREPGAFGENFSTLGMTERDVCVGDIYRVGSALLQVSQGRQPCWKLGLRFDLKKMPILLQETGRTGWYYRVLEEGDAEAGQAIELVDRPNPEWPLTRLLNVLYEDTLNLEELRKMTALTELTESWRTSALHRIKRGLVEDWSARLFR